MTEAGDSTAAGGVGATRSTVHRLAEGTEVTVRMLGPEDREAFLEGFGRLSPESRYLRFFTPMPRLPESMLRRLLHPDGIDHVALAAWRRVDADTLEPIGVARFIRLGNDSDTAEAAIAVVDHMQRRGVGRVLLTDLSKAARERGIRRFRAEVLRGNAAVEALLREVDPSVAPVTVEDNVAVYELDVPGETDPPAASLLFRMFRLIARGVEHDSGTAGDRGVVRAAAPLDILRRKP